MMGQEKLKECEIPLKSEEGIEKHNFYVIETYLKKISFAVNQLIGCVTDFELRMNDLTNMVTEIYNKVIEEKIQVENHNLPEKLKSPLENEGEKLIPNNT